MPINKKDLPALDYTSKLQPGIKGEIVIDAGIYKGRYPSRVEDVRGDTVGFAHPLLKGALLPAYRDMNFVFILEDSGALFEFPMSVRRVDAKTGLPILWAILLDYPKRVQRRNFLRVSCLWDVAIFQLSNESNAPMAGKWFDAKIIDISLGGYRFKTNLDMKFENGDKILVRFMLGAKEYFLLGRASRIIPLKNAWEVGVEFDSVAVSVEKKLFEFIRQQEMLGRD